MNQETDPGSSEVKPGLIRAFLYLDSDLVSDLVRKRSQNLRAK